MNNYIKKKSICLFCSLGCGVAFRAVGENVTAIDYDKESPVNQGSLCPRGHYNIELLNHPRRLIEPQIGKRKVSWEEATAFLRQELKLFSMDEIGIVISCQSSNEEVAAVTQAAKTLGIKNILAAGTAADLEAYEGSKWEVPGAGLATLDDISNAEALLIVGDILNRSPVLAKRINQVKYGKRGNKIIVIDLNKTHTTWFATNHLACRPGTEAVVLAALAGAITPEEGEKSSGVPAGRITSAANEFKAAASGVVIHVPQPTKARNDLAVYFAKKLAAASANKKYIVFYLFGNTLGVNSVIDREAAAHPTYHDLLAGIESDKIKCLLMFGEDISAGHAELQKRFRMLKFVVFAGYFESESPAIYDNSILLPRATQLEMGGSFLLADGRTAKVEPVVEPAGGKTTAEICRLITGEGAGTGAAPEFVTKRKDEAEAVAQIRAIVPFESAPAEPITDFGNNHLVKNFFWHRVNNRG